MRCIDLYTIEKALCAAGYNVADTYENLRSCFLDYVAVGYFSNLEYDEALLDIEIGDISEKDMIVALVNGY